VLDIVPTYEMWRRVDREFAFVDWHWFFLAQPAPFPERLIAAAPDEFYFRGDRARFHPEALSDYLSAVRDPETVGAMCEDYRAGATYDDEVDRVDRESGRKIRCPVHVLWAGRDELGRWFDVVDVWRQWCDGPVSGRALDCGHFLAEESPEQTTAELRSFLERAAARGVGY
jgi:haloacetate dehalogenase